jgi:hypothetical protein
VRELAWDAIAPSTRQAVLGVLTGARALAAPGAVHFAAPAVVAARLSSHEGWRRIAVAGAANAFVSTALSRQRPEPRVVAAGAWWGEHEPAVDAPVPSVTWVAGLGLLAGAAAWAFFARP